MARSGDQFIDNRAIYVRQSEIAALVLVREVFVVNSKKVKDRRLHVVDVNRVLRNVVAQVVGFADRLTTFDTAAGKPHGEGIRVVIPPAFATQSRIIFDHRRSAEFAAPND